MTLDKFGRSDIKKSKSILRGPQGPPGSSGPSGIGFLINSGGHYDLDHKRITNMKNPTHQQDAATKQYVDDQTTSEIKKIINSFLSEISRIQSYVEKFMGYIKINENSIIDLNGKVKDALDKIEKYIVSGTYETTGIQIYPAHGEDNIDKIYHGEVHE